MYRKVIVGSGLAATVVTAAASGTDTTPTETIKKPAEPQKPPPMRASDLPIYDSPHAKYGEYTKQATYEPNPDSYIKSLIVKPVSSVREQVQSVLHQTDSVTSTISTNYNEFQDRTAWIVKYLREEDNKQQRIGAVAMGALTGMIFGLRGGFFRRITYSSIGGGAMAALCFPESSERVARDAATQAKHYINIAYNFCYGVKPGDPQLEVDLPTLSFPKTWSEFSDMAVGWGNAVKTAVMPPPKSKGQTDKSD